MQSQPGKATVTGLGPRITQPHPASTGTAPLTGTGTLNLSALNTTPVKVLSAGDKRGATRKLRVCNLSNTNIAYVAVARNDTAPTITALGVGAATEGTILPNGGGIIETFDVVDTLDVYMVASAASIVQISVFEQ